MSAAPNYYAPKAARSSSRSTTWSAAASASRARPSSRSTTLTGIDDQQITAGSMFMDSSTDFGGELHPDRRRQPRARPGPGPERPAVLAEHPVGQGRGDQRAGPCLREGAGLRDGLPDRPTTAGLSIALGVQEVRPVDLITAYGTLANGGKTSATRRSCRSRTRRATPSSTRTCRRPARRPPAPGRLHRHRHPRRQHAAEREPVLGQVRDHRARTASAGRRRSRPARTTTPRTSTPTATSPADRPSRAAGAYALAAGAWNGNSDNTPCLGGRPAPLHRRHDLAGRAS